MVKREVSWEEVGVIPLTPPDFKTHLNYVLSMKEFSDGLKLKLNSNIHYQAKFKKASLSKKLNFIKMIKENLDDEHKKSMEETEFAKICSMWIPVKSYYLIFNQLLVLCSIFNNNEENINYSHTKSIVNFMKMIKEGKISFNKDNFNIVCPFIEAISFKTKRGDNFKKDLEEELRIKGILKKLCSYKFESYRRDEKIKEFRTKKDKEKKKLFFENNEISLFEFFYWYRIKTNYRDLSFLDQEVYSGEIAQFYENYYLLTMNFYIALKDLINDISKKRLGEILIKT